jgi:hypothetical protein
LRLHSEGQSLGKIAAPSVAAGPLFIAPSMVMLHCGDTLP